MFQDPSTSSNTVESLAGFFWICSALSEISVAFSLSERRFRFMAKVKDHDFSLNHIYRTF